MYLSIKTNDQDTHITLMNDDAELVGEKTWQPGRELSNQLFNELNVLLESNNVKPEDLQGIIVFKGPGSFTGLRIGITVANAFAYSLHIPIVAAQNEDWVQTGLEKLQRGESDTIALPDYGAEAHITQPRK